MIFFFQQPRFIILFFWSIALIVLLSQLPQISFHLEFMSFSKTLIYIVKCNYAMFNN